jgi:hypothetical protein
VSITSATPLAQAEISRVPCETGEAGGALAARQGNLAQQASLGQIDLCDFGCILQIDEGSALAIGHGKFQSAGQLHRAGHLVGTGVDGGDRVITRAHYRDFAGCGVKEGRVRFVSAGNLGQNTARDSIDEAGKARFAIGLDKRLVVVDGQNLMAALCGGKDISDLMGCDIHRHDGVAACHIKRATGRGNVGKAPSAVCTGDVTDNPIAGRRGMNCGCGEKTTGSNRCRAVASDRQHDDPHE